MSVLPTRIWHFCEGAGVNARQSGGFQHFSRAFGDVRATRRRKIKEKQFQVTMRVETPVKVSGAVPDAETGEQCHGSAAC
jgi:hypothetical protein